MRISLAVPTLNSSTYLGRCLTSIVSQSHSDIEVLVQDGGSTDRTLDIAEHFRYHNPRKVFIEQSKDKNEPDAINKALSRASGCILAWLDSDDVYTDKCLELVNNIFELEKADWVYGKCKIIDGNDKEVRGFVTKAKEQLQNRYSYSLLQMVDFIPQPSAFFSRKTWEKVGELNINEKFVFDYEYWLRLGARYEPVFINQYLACWRAHSNSLSVKHFKKEAQDAKRVAGAYTQNPIIKLGQQVVYNGTIALYHGIK